MKFVGYTIMSLRTVEGTFVRSAAVTHIAPMIVWPASLGTMVLSYVQPKWRGRVSSTLMRLLTQRYLERASSAMITVTKGVASAKDIELLFMNLLGADN